MNFNGGRFKIDESKCMPAKLAEVEPEAEFIKIYFSPCELQDAVEMFNAVIEAYNRRCDMDVPTIQY